MRQPLVEELRRGNVAERSESPSWQGVWGFRAEITSGFSSR